MSLSLRLDTVESKLGQVDRNYIINGGMHYWQRGTSISIAKSTTDGYANGYSADRMSSYVARNGFDIGVTNSQISDVPSGMDVVYSMNSQANSTYSFGSTSAALLPLYQPIEGTTVNDWKPGDKVYISFWVKTSAAVPKLSVALRKMDSSGSSIEYSYVWYTATPATTWTRVYKQITLPATAIHKGTAASFNLLIGGISGTAGTQMSSDANIDEWQAGDKWTGATATNWAASGTPYIRVTGIKISRSPHTDFSIAGRHLADELLLCQRYYERSYDLTVAPGSNTNPGSFRNDISGGTLNVYFKAPKRVIPTMSLYFTSGISAGVAQPLYTGLNCFTGYSVNANYTFHYTADAEL